MKFKSYTTHKPQEKETRTMNKTKKPVQAKMLLATLAEIVRLHGPETPVFVVDTQDKDENGNIISDIYTIVGAYDSEIYATKEPALTLTIEKKR